MNQGWYQPADAIANLLRAGRRRRRQRMLAADMLSLREASSLMSADESTIIGWVRCGRCIALEVDRTMKLPRWQFDPFVWPEIQRIGQALGTIDGWQVLTFLETSNPALDGRSPRVALEQSIPISRILAAAAAEAH